LRAYGYAASGVATDPSLPLQNAHLHRQDLIIGASLQMSVLLGQYDDDKLVNIGTHRWSFKPELGGSKALGPLRLGLSMGVTIYTDNHDFLDGKTHAQVPIYSVQGHVSYDVGAGI
jgi:hypothetical protein